jgi:hypothetical protein
VAARVKLAVLFAVLSLTVSGALPAAAGDLPDRTGPEIASLLSCERDVDPPRCVSVGNNSVHYVYIRRSVPEKIAKAVRRVMREHYERTNLRMIVQSTITSRTDVIVFAADYGQNGAAGWVWCPPDAPRGTTQYGDRWCRHQQLHFNLNARYAAFFADAASRDYMACHELGHTIGLWHWGNPPRTDGPHAETCMQADVPNGPRHLAPSDRRRINDYYPLPASPPLARLRALAC